jgi:hypothetical protein
MNLGDVFGQDLVDVLTHSAVCWQRQNPDGDTETSMHSR